ncbi:MAG: type II toxin-antitoxin system VapC family toxin [Actinomycetota bacterium]
MIAYFDTSAVVKLLIDEPGSETVERVWHATDARVCATVGYTEAVAALGRAGRMGRLSPAAVSRSVAGLADIWTSFHRSLVDDELASQAATLALAHGLRGFDAIHLAAAVSGAELLVTADQSLLTAAMSLGLSVADVAA